MNFLSDFDSAWQKWPEIPEKSFEQLLQTLDYWRDAWSDVIVYHDKPGGRIFAYEVYGSRTRKTRYLVHPELQLERP